MLYCNFLIKIVVNKYRFVQYTPKITFINAESQKFLSLCLQQRGEIGNKTKSCCLNGVRKVLTDVKKSLPPGTSVK
jgi:hypothetical protein